MTQALADAHWIGPPSLSHRWMAGMLHLLAMVWSYLACLFGMRLSRLTRECHTDVTPQALPRRDREPINEEPTSAAASSRRTTIALMVSRCASAHRPSNHEGVLTPASCGSFSGKAEGVSAVAPTPRIPVLETGEPSVSPSDAPTKIPGTRRYAPWPRMTRDRKLCAPARRTRERSVSSSGGFSLHRIRTAAGHIAPT